ncbi:MAG: hypothetical protein HKN76_07075, partial [Saprospiraceae bacterium]|nr:hypothetical protein [Saprospiraceae bacterium]
MKIYLVALLSLFSIIEDARAQIKHYNYFDVSNGLSSNHLTDLAEAGDGYIWITTNGAGLTRYDGISFENFLDEKETGGLFYYSIYASANDVWFGTENRLLKYSSGNFTSYRIPAVGLIKKIVPFTPEILFCIGNQGSAFFSTTQGTIKHQSISGLKFNDAIYQDHILYAGTTQGLLSFKNDTWEKVALVTDFQLGNCSLVTPDMQGNILMVDAENGLVKYSRDGMADILADPADFPVDKISFLKEGALGDIFLGTTDQGILIFQPYDSLWQNLDNRQLNYDDISNMIFDRWENAWIATRGGGLIRFSSQNFTLRKWPELSGKYIDRLNMWNDTLHITYRDAQSEILVHDKIRPFLRSGDEGEALLAATRMSPVRKWYSTETALYYVSDSLHYKVPVGGSAAYGTVSQILGLDSQEVLILSGDQLYRMKVIDTGAISGPVFLDTLLINGGVDALLRDQAERIWYYGPRKAGILGATSLDVGSSRVTALLPIDQKRILIGTQNNGLRLFRDFNQANTGAEILVDGNSFPEIRALALDESGKIWISLRNEVWETEISGTDAMVIRRYNEKVGWPRLETRQNALE